MNTENNPSENLPLVSVIIPFFDRIEYTLESVRSVIDQSYENWELILVNDGSTESLDPLEELIKRDSRIRLLTQENKGVSAARNHGIREAKGDYIAFLDSDDLWEKNKLAVQISYMEENSVAFSHTSYQRIKNDGTPLEIVHSGLQRGQVYPELMSNCGIATPTVVVRRALLEDRKCPFSEDFHIGEDICLWIDLAAECEFGGVDKPLSLVRISDSSAAFSSEKQAIGQSNILRYINDNAKYRTEFFQVNRLWDMICQLRSEKEENPLVSIVIPVYNGANYMRDAIDSALAQTYKNIEIIVVNDGSNDEGETERIALSYGDRIRYIHKENGGVATALNAGIREMRGEYFSWLSHDDMYKPEKIEREMAIIRASGRKDTIAAGGYEVVNASGKYMYSVNIASLYPRYRLSGLFVLLRGGIHGCAMLIHKSHFERVGLFDPSLPSTQDYELWFRMFQKCPFYYYEGNYVLSRWHEEQGSKKMKNHLRDCNALWIWMMDKTPKEKRIEICGSEAAFFDELYVFLRDSTGYTEAIEYAERCKNALLGMPEEEPPPIAPGEEPVVSGVQTEELPEKQSAPDKAAGQAPSASALTLRPMTNAERRMLDESYRKDVIAMQRSFSWRITAPLRWIKKHLLWWLR